jgi:hypothetical protein
MEERWSLSLKKRLSPDDLIWSSQDLIPKHHEFDPSTSGYKANVTERSTVREFLEIFFSMTLIEMISRFYG